MKCNNNSIYNHSFSIMIKGELMPVIDLNQDQKEAVEYFSKKPLLIRQCQGSGKTRVIIERVPNTLIQEKKN